LAVDQNSFGIKKTQRKKGKKERERREQKKPQKQVHTKK
jgi:hypothetical protein